MFPRAPRSLVALAHGKAPPRFMQCGRAFTHRRGAHHAGSSGSSGRRPRHRRESSRVFATAAGERAGALGRPRVRARPLGRGYLSGGRCPPHCRAGAAHPRGDVVSNARQALAQRGRQSPSRFPSLCAPSPSPPPVRLSFAHCSPRATSPLPPRRPVPGCALLVAACGLGWPEGSPPTCPPSWRGTPTLFTPDQGLLFWGPLRSPSIPLSPSLGAGTDHGARRDRPVRIDGVHRARPGGGARGDGVGRGDVQPQVHRRRPRRVPLVRGGGGVADEGARG